MKNELALLLAGCVLSACSTMPALFSEDDEMPRKSFTQNQNQFSGRWHPKNFANDGAAAPANTSSETNTIPDITSAVNLGYDPKISFDTPDKAEPRLPEGCSIKDRFDRTALMAYNFTDRQSRLSFHMDVDGPRLSAPARLEVNEVMLRFRYKFHPAENHKEKCLYPSGFQGWGGSTYNEFFVREKDTIRQELMDKNPFGVFD